MYADMVGYSHLIGLDDQGTLTRLRALRRSLIDPAVEEHGGKIVQTGGDSLLIVFDSIDGAVRCAVKVQQQVPVIVGERPPDRAMRFRVGINLGDAIADGTDLHGDTVNVAARLQVECPPGNICVTRPVRDHVQDRLNLKFEELGPLTLKNIARPVEAFLLKLGSNEPPVPAPPSTMPFLGRPSIAVLAFTNISGDPDQEYFPHGIADDITTELSRNRSLLVITSGKRGGDVKQIARELGVRYVLGGSVRRTRERVRVSVRLIDAEIGSHIWAEHYDCDVSDVFAVQDDVTRAVIRAITPTVVNAERQRALRQPPGNLGAWEAVQRGLWHFWLRRLEDLPLAREFLDRALELDPNYASAHRALSLVYGAEGFFFGSGPLSEALALAADEARIALELDPTDALCHVTRAFGYGNLGDFWGAFQHVERALEINSNCAGAYFARGWLQLYTGQPAEARDAILFSFRLDPRSASDVEARCDIAQSYYFERDYENAADIARHVAADRPDYSRPYQVLAAALGQLGRPGEARDALDRAVTVAPHIFDLYVRQRVPWMRQPDYEHMLDGLHKTGWQD